MQNIQAFLLLPTSNPLNDFFKGNDDLVLDENLIADYLNQLEIFLDTAYQEKATEVYYSESNILQFLSGFEAFEDEYLSNPSGRLSDILQNAENWEVNASQADDTFYVIWRPPNSHQTLYAPHTLAEIVERMKPTLTDKIVLIDHQATHNEGDFIVIARDFLVNSDVPVFRKLDSTSNVEMLEKWLLNNRQPRIFNLNPKHGESGKSAKSNKDETVSLLRCNRNEAAELLKIAKGDKRLSKELFAYDAIHSRFIIFKDENTAINSYHGYHVDDENEVPLKIRNILRPKLYKLN